MNLLIVEPFFTGSHALWANGYSAHSRHEVQILKLGGSNWKWRMHGGAVTLARRFLESGLSPDVIVATDMLDLTTFLSLTRRETAGTPVAVYFHENQLTYPWSPKDRDLKRNRDRHYAFINYTAALACDRVFFNSAYHRNSFLGELPVFLKQFPDHQEAGSVGRLDEKSDVLPLGFDLQWFDDIRSAADQAQAAAGGDGRGDAPLILWNHRWEYDKNPDEFFEALRVLAKRGRRFDVALVGEVFDVTPEAFGRGITDLGDRIKHSGYVRDRREYGRWLWRADLLPVTSIHDFFGSSIMEAIYCGCIPLLPRRLAYPELIPQALHDRCFYDNLEELVERLDDLVQDTDAHRTGSFREVAAQYDWRIMAPRYDTVLEELVGSQ